MSKINMRGDVFELISFAEALARIGMDGKVRGAEAFKDALVVGTSPDAMANPGKGNLWCFCSGPVLYSFSTARKAPHLPDEPWAWTVSGVIYVVIKKEGIAGSDTYLEAVTPSP